MPASSKLPCWGVYRVFKNGKIRYLSRSATHSKALAKDIAEERSRGLVTLPDGRVKQIQPFPHIYKEITP